MIDCLELKRFRQKRSQLLIASLFKRENYPRQWWGAFLKCLHKVPSAFHRPVRISDTWLRHNDERLGDRLTLPQNSLRAVLEWREVFVRCQFIFAKGTGLARNLNAGFGHTARIVWTGVLQTRLRVWTFSPIVCVICGALFYVNVSDSTTNWFLSVILCIYWHFVLF